MSDTHETDIKEMVEKMWSDEEFILSELWPKIGQEFGEGSLNSIEGLRSIIDQMVKYSDLQRSTIFILMRTQEDLKNLDLENCIDYKFTYRGGARNGGFFYIAMRKQWTYLDRKPFNTFTVRSVLGSGMKTEMHKMIDIQGDQSRVGPFINIHYYQCIECKKLLSAALCKTRDLYSYAINQSENTRYNSEDGKGFEHYSWKDMIDSGIEVKTYPADLNTQQTCSCKTTNQ